MAHLGGNSAPPLCFSVLGCVEKSSTQFFRFCGTQKDRAHIIISRLNVNFASRCHINMTEGCDMWQGNLHQDVINRAHNFSLTFSADIIILRACVDSASKHTPPRHDPSSYRVLASWSNPRHLPYRIIK